MPAPEVTARTMADAPARRAGRPRHAGPALPRRPGRPTARRRVRAAVAAAVVVIAALLTGCGAPAGDPCAGDPAGCAIDAACDPGTGAGGCGCPAGTVADGGGCVDVDECAVDHGGCAPDADCVNLDGSHACACHPGFVGDGYACAWEDPLVASTLPGVQLNVSSDGPRNWPFANVLHGCDAWVFNSAVTTPEQAQAFAASLVLDAQDWPVGARDAEGNVVGLPAGTKIEIHAMNSTTGWFDFAARQYVARMLRGVYVLTWDGTGDVSLLPSINDGRGEVRLLTTPGRIVMRLDTDEEYVVVHVRNSSATDPVRDLALWAPAYDGAGLSLTVDSDLSVGNVAGSLEPAPGAPAPLFHPAFLAHLAEAPDAGVLRFLGWLRINGLDDESPVDWEARAPADAVVHGLAVIDGAWTRHRVPAFRDRVGYPYEWLIALANATGRDLWLQVPHTATPRLVDELARLVARQLDPARRAWFEFSNELWNSAGPYLPQRRRAEATAAEHFGVPAASLSMEQLAWGAGRLQAEALRVFEDAWRAEGRFDHQLVNVAAGFGESASYNRALVASLREVDPELPEVLAGSNYFGHDAQAELFSLHPFGDAVGAWPPALFDAAAAVLRRRLHATAGAWAANGVAARELGLPLVSYEGGQHLLIYGYGDRTQPDELDFAEFVQALQRSPQMGALYREQYALWSMAGGVAPSLWVDTGTWSFWGYWGAKEYVLQTRADSPKWDAFAWFGEAQRGVRARAEPVASRPVLQPGDALRGEVGLSFTGAIASLGGDAPLTVSVLAGQLPPGVAFTDGGDGTAQLAGTPTTAGLFRPILRVRDRDGDVDDLRFDVVVDPAGLSAHALVVFRGPELPASLNDDGTRNGRYDPVRPTTVLAGGGQQCVEFSNDVPLFDDEFLGSQQLAATSPLNPYGGWCLSALDGATRVAAPELSSWVGLRAGGFNAWTGDLQGPSSLDLVLLWQRPQFAPLPAGHTRYAFGDTAATLQVDLTSVVGDGTNVVRFVVVDHHDGADHWYVSEAAWTRAELGDGILRVEAFSGSDVVGRRWAEIPAPTSWAPALPSTGLTYQPHAFTDVRAVGLGYRGSRWRWHSAFGLSRFFALGETW